MKKIKLWLIFSGGLLLLTVLTWEAAMELPHGIRAFVFGAGCALINCLGYWERKIRFPV